jgi:hypothetical protein
MLSISPTTVDMTTAAPVAAGDVSWLHMPGWRFDLDAGIDAAKRALVREGKIDGKAPGARGPGSKPRRARSTNEFSKGFETVASDRSYARTNRKSAKAKKLEEDKASGLLDEIKRTLAAAEVAILDGTATHEQKMLALKAEDRAFFMQRYVVDETAWDRIFGTGFVWKGGMVAGKYYRGAFVKKGLKSWEHPFFQRIVASIGRAASRTLWTGPAKDKCALRWKKLPALDEAYAFFCAVCRDLFRLDLDKIFASEAHLRAWIAYIVEENGLPCGPHIIDWIPDDRFPGVVIRPQLIFLLPEGNAVWKTSDPPQHTMLGQVIAGLTKVFQCDRGGLSDPFSGKNPISPVVEAKVYQDTHMPTLSEYFEALDCTLDPARMFRYMSTQALEEVGFDRTDSNTWFTIVARLANFSAQDLFKQGFPTADAERLKKRLIKAITPAVLETIKPTPAQRKTVDKLIECCSRYASKTFDPAKMDTKGRDRGAATHLIEATDSKHVKQSKGRAYAGSVQIAETRAIITKAIRLELAAGCEPTIASITAIVPRCYNSVKAHFFACYQTAIASISLKTLLRGYHTFPGISVPPVPCS